MLKNNLENFLKNKKQFLIIAVGVLGILLLFLSEFTGNKKNEKKDDSTKTFSAEEYTDYTERRLKTLVCAVKGAGRAEVMITLDSAGELYLAEDTQSESTEDENGTAHSEQRKPIAAEDGGIATRQEEPVIRGVAVVCEGAGSDIVKREITETVRAALGVSRDKIYVAEMQKNSEESGGKK